MYDRLRGLGRGIIFWHVFVARLSLVPVLIYWLRGRQGREGDVDMCLYLDFGSIERKWLTSTNQI